MSSSCLRPPSASTKLRQKPKSQPDPPTKTADGPFTQNDLTFLKSLRISLTEDATPTDQASVPQQRRLPPGTPDNTEA